MSLQSVPFAYNLFWIKISFQPFWPIKIFNVKLNPLALGWCLVSEEVGVLFKILDQTKNCREEGLANATYFEWHGMDATTGLSYAMDISLLMNDATKDPVVFVQDFIQRFEQDELELLLNPKHLAERSLKKHLYFNIKSVYVNCPI
jgi:hypothetical protein